MISRIALRRLCEERLAMDEVFRQRFLRDERPALGDVRELSDADVVRKLTQACGVSVDRDWLDGKTQCHVAAYLMADEICKASGLEDGDLASDTVWLCLICLWERWFPDRPNMEMIDDRMQAGYAALKGRDDALACQHWKSAWRAILEITHRLSIDSIEEFDQAFDGTQLLYNWVQDYDELLSNTSAREEQFAHDRIALATNLLGWRGTDELMTGNFRRAAAESHFMLGDSEAGDSLFTQWLQADPSWGWGWIGWSDAYFTCCSDAMGKQPERAIELLRQGLAVPDLRDRAEVLDRLAMVYDDIGRGQDAELVRAQMEKEVPSERGRNNNSIGSHAMSPELGSSEVRGEVRGHCPPMGGHWITRQRCVSAYERHHRLAAFPPPELPGFNGTMQPSDFPYSFPSLSF